MTPPERPPIDPATAARHREATAAEDRSHWWSIAAMASQFMLGGIAGAWAAQIADDGSETIGIYAGVACVFAVAGALAASRAAQFAVGGVMALFGLPDLIRKVRTGTLLAPGPLDPRQVRQEWWLHAFATAVHAVVLLVLFLLVAVAVSVYAQVGLGELALRFALASGVVSLLTWKALKLDL